ncbi:kinase-like domain-containing protein, partial [Zychaea mexicana]|uniref:kinase-like domain-containing protein n=1 Tax=Zychaea mexicana TaxID=64656 RepID=UPI0022FEF7B3
NQQEDIPARLPSSLTRIYKVSNRTLGVGSFAVDKLCTHKSQAKHRIENCHEKGYCSKFDIHIISMHGLFEDAHAVYIVADHAKGSYTERDASNLVRQILEGLAYLHEHDVNFGLSRIIKDHDGILMTACGTPGYVAPEILLRTGHGTPVDIWSVGVITYTLLGGYTPIWGADEATLFDSIIRGHYEFDEEYWSDNPASAKHLIDCMLQLDPEKRITATEALQHPWISQGRASATDLIANIRKGFTNRQSFRSFTTAVSQSNKQNERSSIFLL